MIEFQGENKTHKNIIRISKKIIYKILENELNLSEVNEVLDIVLNKLYNTRSTIWIGQIESIAREELLYYLHQKNIPLKGYMFDEAGQIYIES
jgi:hypothetical protein